MRFVDQSDVHAGTALTLHTSTGSFAVQNTGHKMSDILLNCDVVLENLFRKRTIGNFRRVGHLRVASSGSSLT